MDSSSKNVWKVVDESVKSISEESIWESIRLVDIWATAAFDRKTGLSDAEIGESYARISLEAGKAVRVLLRHLQVTRISVDAITGDDGFLPQEVKCPTFEFTIRLSGHRLPKTAVVAVAEAVSGLLGASTVKGVTIAVPEAHGARGADSKFL